MSKYKSGLKVITFFCLAAAFCLLRLGNIFDGTLAFGLYVGVLYSSSLILPTILFVCSGAINGIESFMVAFVQAAVMVTASLVHIKTKTKINRWLLLLYTLAANVFFLLYKTEQSEILRKVACVAVGILFCFVCIFALRALFLRGLKYKIGADEGVCISLVAIALFLGMCKITFFGLSLLNFLSPLFILIMLKSGGGKIAFVSAATIGVAFAFNSGNLTMLAVLFLWTAAAAVFVDINRILSALALLLCEIVLAYFFEIYGMDTTATLISTLASCAVFCCIPKALLVRMSIFLGQETAQYSPRHIVNRLRTNLSRRLFELSEVFFAMQSTFKSLTRGVLPPEKAVFAISNEITDRACKDCPQKLKCWRNDAESSQKHIHQLVNCCIDRGKVTLLDLPPYLANKCLRASTILSCANSEVANYRQFYLVNNSFDNSRMLLGNVADGISKVMLTLSRDSRATLSFDSQKEKQMIEQLTYFNVLVKEAVILSGDSFLSVTLIVDKKDADKPQIAEIVSDVCGFPLVLRAKETPASDNWTAMYYSPKPRYDLSVGIASVKKNGSEISGDTHSFIRLNDDKYLLALCDGMGSGVRAEQASATAIGLVENFYRAGFDNDLILGCINKLLTAANSEVFTALDLCVVDLKNGASDFIKLGAPPAIIRCGKAIQFVEGACLPIGVLEEIKPSITKKVMGKNDLILLASDGFWDSFDEVTTPAVIFDQCTLTNPQLIAENLLEQALGASNGVAKDDVTVLVAKIY